MLLQGFVVGQLGVGYAIINNYYNGNLLYVEFIRNLDLTIAGCKEILCYVLMSFFGLPTKYKTISTTLMSDDFFCQLSSRCTTIHYII